MRMALFSVAALLAASAAGAEARLGVTMDRFDDNYLTLLRNGMSDYAATLDGVELQVEDAQVDLNRQSDQIRNFIASGVDAIIVNAVDTDATVPMTAEAEASGMPLVFVNRVPANLDTLPRDQAVVASDERVSGTLQMREVCRLLGGQGRIVVLVGDLVTEAARLRTQDIHDVIAEEPCSGIEVVEQQVGGWSRIGASDLVLNWISAGTRFDAVVANNDEMALGAIQALKSAGISLDDVVVAGIDATEEALDAMADGDLKVTVYQNAKAQGEAAVETALKLRDGEQVDRIVWVPFELVTPENMSSYVK